MSISLYALFLGSSLYVLYRIRSGRKRQLPPGPKGWPILGNLLELRGDTPIWEIFDSMKDKYGPIVYMNLAGVNVVILNTKESANELMDRRSTNYSDRPKTIVGGYLGAFLALPLARYGKSWQTMRRASHSVLSLRATADYYPGQINEALILTHDLLHKTAPPMTSIQRTAASTMVSLCYARPPLRSDEPILQSLDEIAHRFGALLYPGAYLVEIFPVLDYFPQFMAKWKRDARKDYKKYTAFFQQCFEEALEHKEKASLSVKLAEEQITTGLTDLQKYWVAGTIYIAGFETTANMIAWLLHAMTIHPDVQRKAQEEIDRVVGRVRTPTFGDMEHLPYIRAVVKEVLRWQPAGPFGVPHVSDDWYEDYFIPKGTICISNVWSINRSSDTYGTDAHEFRPERFLNEDGTLLSDEDGHSAYGFGRRVCVGRHVADNSLFISIATILWALNIVPSADKDVLQHKTELRKDVFNPCPDFQSSFVPRFPEVEGILSSMRDEIVQF
ncbi:cytochrome P450 [Rhodocollybia butyracea]|uniref:Cytochrome P450 n=1 Tax=Rhodocollybia butyracea TaxID=206335 RepID=A0A9P5PAZ8_9AGAR|nr:cytochrome P450 [Rhodocollybia butyracea]